MAAMNDAFACLARQAERLNEATDDMNGVIAAMESRLEDISPGVTAWTRIAESTGRVDENMSDYFLSAYDASLVDGAGYESRQELGYAKQHNEWRLLVRESYYFGGEEEAGYVAGPRLLANDSRDVRLLAIQHFEVLLTMLAARAEGMADSVERAKALVEGG